MKIKYFLYLLLFLSLVQCTDKKKEALVLKKQANKALYNSQFDDAFSIIKKSIKYNPHDPEAWFILGNVYLNKRQVDSALHAYSKAIEVDSTFGPAYANRAKILKERKKREEACRDFLKAEKYGVRSLYEETKFCK